MDHSLHKKIGAALIELGKTLKAEIRLAPECGQVQDQPLQSIPLFIKSSKSQETEKRQETEICNVDALVIKDGKIKIIIEIEESNIKPTQICGKFLTSNFAEIYAHDSLGKGKGLKIEKSSIVFIQVIDIKKLPDKSSKPDQFIHIEKAINNLIQAAIAAKIEHGCIKKYLLIHGDKPGNKDDTKLIDDFKKAIMEEID